MIPELILAGKVVSLFLAIAFGFVNIVKAFRGQSFSSANNYMMSAGITTFVTLQWLI